MIVPTVIGLAGLLCVVAIILFGCVQINKWEERQEAKAKAKGLSHHG